jgi:hypothetical protein
VNKSIHMSHIGGSLNNISTPPTVTYLKIYYSSPLTNYPNPKTPRIEFPKVDVHNSNQSSLLTKLLFIKFPKEEVIIKHQQSELTALIEENEASKGEEMDEASKGEDVIGIRNPWTQPLV